MSFPGDEYIKLYSLNHSTKKFKLKLDVKRSIKSLSRDYTKKHYFFSLDNYGDENYQIYKLDLKTNKYEKLFGNNGARATIADYSNNGNYLYIRSNHENGKIYRIYKFNLLNKRIEAISPKDSLIHEYLHYLQAENMNKLFGKRYKHERIKIQNKLVSFWRESAKNVS